MVVAVHGGGCTRDHVGNCSLDHRLEMYVFLDAEDVLRLRAIRSATTAVSVFRWKIDS